LNKAATRKSQQKGLKVIVGYRGAAAAATKADVREAGDTKLRRTLKSLNADAVQTPQKPTRPDLWDAVTNAQDGSARTAVRDRACLARRGP
jgi:hypothetical protein